MPLKVVPIPVPRGLNMPDEKSGNQSEALSKKETEIPSTLSFHHIKSNYFRVIHADGVWGGVTPHLDIQMAFFSERTPIPQLVKHSVGPDGLGEELKSERVAREGIVREIEASIVVDVEVAKVLRAWLDDKIKQAEEIAAAKGAKE
jgi:hypothetical protein